MHLIQSAMSMRSLSEIGELDTQGSPTTLIGNERSARWRRLPKLAFFLLVPPTTD